jgi:hypothetical protein
MRPAEAQVTPIGISRDRETVLASITLSEDDVSALRAHVKEIAASKGFRGSDRCARFLQYIVEQAIAGRAGALKERVIGVEVFGRPSDYDTSQDAIVRVTASDLRKRLLRHYGKSGSHSRFQIHLPVGSYIPEIACEPRGSYERVGHTELHSAVVQPQVGEPSTPHSTLASAGPDATVADNRVKGLMALSRWRSAALLLVALVAILSVFDFALSNTAHKELARAKPTQNLTLPWSALLSSMRPTHLVTSDIDIVKIQRFIGRRISASEYANGSYISELNSLSPELKRISLTMLSGDKAPLIDTRIVAGIAGLAKDGPGRIDVVGARSLKFQDLKSDDNFIFLGSPYSDPWFMVFNDQLDFRIQSRGDKDLGPEFIANVRPGPDEQLVYSATAIGGGTGDTWGLLALVNNPNQYGQVLLIAGISGEGTQAAGELATDLPSLNAALQKCGISTSGPLKHFEMLLHIKIMAGYPSQYEVAACHILANSGSR